MAMLGPLRASLELPVYSTRKSSSSEACVPRASTAIAMARSASADTISTKRPHARWKKPRLSWCRPMAVS